MSSTSRARRSERIEATPPATIANASVTSQKPKSSSGKQLAHVHVAPLLLRELEQRRRLEIERARNDQVGKRLDADVVEVHGLVVELAPVGDRLLEFADACLQVLEAAVRLEVRVVLGEREELPEPLPQL